MSNADIKTLLIVSYSCRSFHLWLMNGWAKSKLRAFTRRMFRQIWTELAKLGIQPQTIDSRNWLTPDYTLLRVRENFVLQTVSQNGTKLMRSAFSGVDLRNPQHPSD